MGWHLAWDLSPVRAYSLGAGLCPEKLVKLKKNNNYINWYTKVILVATFVNFPLDIYHILNDSSLNNCHNKLLENHTFPVYVLMPVNEYYKIYRSK